MIDALHVRSVWLLQNRAAERRHGVKMVSLSCEPHADLISISCPLTSQPIICGCAVKKPVGLQNDMKKPSPAQRKVRGQFEGNGVEGELKGADAGGSHQFNLALNEILV